MRAEFLSPVRVLPSTQGERIKYSRRWQWRNPDRGAERHASRLPAWRTAHPV